MSGGYDGSIRIDTSIDDKSFNGGITKMSAAISGAMGKVVAAVGTVATVVGTVVAVVAGIALAFVGVAAAIVGFGIQLINTMSQAISRTNAYGQMIANLEKSFADVKGAVYAAFSPLITAAVPYIMLVVNWLVKMLNTVAMVIAALTGQRSVMQYIAGSAASAATDTGRLAGETNKATKAAKGALAAFDQLNVLQKDTADASAGGVGAGGGAMQFTEVPVDPAIQEKVDTVKKWFADAWKFISDNAVAAWAWIKQAAADTWNWIVTAWGNIGSFFTSAWNWVKQAATDAWTWITTQWGALGQWFQDNVIQPLLNFFIPMWNFFSTLAYDAWLVIAYVWSIVGAWFKAHVTDPIANWFKIAWDNVKQWASDAWGKVVSIWTVVSTWFSEHVTEPIKKAFGTALDWVKTKWENIFNGIRDFVKGILNKIIDFLNSFLSGFSSGINGIIGSLNTVGSKIPGWATIPTYPTAQIPHLATGAVIPANAPFAAILGDQKSGRNIEAPEGLLRQLFEEYNSKIEVTSTVNFNGSLGALVRELKPVIDFETNRVGSSLIKSGVS